MDCFQILHKTGFQSYAKFENYPSKNVQDRELKQSAGMHTDRQIDQHSNAIFSCIV